MASLTGQSISTTYDSLLKLTDNGPITASFKEITDGLGNSSGVFLKSTGQIKLGNYITTTSFTGTAVGYLAFTSAGEIITTAIPGVGITTLNTLTASTQTFAVGTSGTDFAISSATSTHTFNLPTASATNRGALSSADWTTFNGKIGGSGTTNTLPKFTGASALGNSNITDSGTLISLGSNSKITGLLDITNTYANTNWQIETTESGGDSNFYIKYLGSSGYNNVAYFYSDSTGSNEGFVTDRISTSVFVQTPKLVNNSLSSILTLIPSGGNSPYFEDALGIGGVNSSTSTNQLSVQNVGGKSIVVNIGGNFSVTGHKYLNITSSRTTTGTLANLYYLYATQGSLTGTTTNQFGVFIDSTLTGATNNYGVYSNIASGANRWNLFINGTASNYIGGALGIGATTLTGYNVRIGKSLTGSTTMRGIYQESVIQSDVTSLVTYNTTYAGTQAAAFTLGSIYHYEAVQGVFGASSAVTNQNGFRVDSSLIGATNNYGFRGLIASGTNRWNIYMDGTASNHIQGTTLIGSATDNGSGAKLQVTGGISYQNIFNRQTASYTLALTDQNDIVETNVATANNLTIPLNSSVAFPIGTEIQVLQYGAGQTTIVATSGVTTRSKSGQLKIANQYTGVTLVKVGTDEWYVIGNLSA